jgi:hypothetical protein
MRRAHHSEFAQSEAGSTLRHIRGPPCHQGEHEVRDMPELWQWLEEPVSASIRRSWLRTMSIRLFSPS